MDKEERRALKHWFEKYQKYATRAELALGPHAYRMSNTPGAKGYHDPNKAIMRYHSDNEEAKRRLQVIQNIKDVGDVYLLYGDVLYYRLMLGMPTPAVIGRLWHYHNDFDVLDETNYVPNSRRVYDWQRKGLDAAGIIVPQEWYLCNEALL